MEKLQFLLESTTHLAESVTLLNEGATTRYGKKYASAQKRLTKMVEKAKKVSFLNMLEADRKAGIELIEKNVKPKLKSDAEKQEVADYVSWLKDGYKKMIASKIKELEKADKK